MARYRSSHTTSTPIEAAFDFLSRFSTTEQWDPGVVEARDLTPGPVGVGSAFAVVSQFLGRKVPLRYEVVAYDRPTLFTVLAENSSIRSTDTVTFVDNGDGTTTVTYDAELAPRGVTKLFGPLLKIAFDRIGDRGAEGLAKAVDALAPVSDREDRP